MQRKAKLLILNCMTTDMKRLVILLPEEVHEAFIRASETRYESMSNLGRRLLIEWLEQNGYLDFQKGANSNPDNNN